MFSNPQGIYTPPLYCRKSNAIPEYAEQMLGVVVRIGVSIIKHSVIVNYFLQVRNGDNVSFLFASTLPKLFSGSFPSCLKEKLHIDQ